MKGAVRLTFEGTPPPPPRNWIEFLMWKNNINLILIITWWSLIYYVILTNFSRSSSSKNRHFTSCCYHDNRLAWEDASYPIPESLSSTIRELIPRDVAALPPETKNLPEIMHFNISYLKLIDEKMLPILRLHHEFFFIFKIYIFHSFFSLHSLQFLGFSTPAKSQYFSALRWIT